MLIHYAQAAPLCKITQLYEQSRSGANLTEILEQVKQQMSQLQSRTRPEFDAHQFEDRVAALERDIQTLVGCTRAMVQTGNPESQERISQHSFDFVMNRASKTWHVVDTDGMAHPPEERSTKCGWKFAKAKFFWSIDAPTEHGKRCNKCWNNTDSDTANTDKANGSTRSAFVTRAENWNAYSNTARQNWRGTPPEPGQSVTIRGETLWGRIPPQYRL